MTLPSTWERSLISPNISICSSPPAVPLTAPLIFKFTSPGNSPSARNSFLRLPVRFENENEFHTARAGGEEQMLVFGEINDGSHVERGVAPAAVFHGGAMVNFAADQDVVPHLALEDR